MAEAHPEMTCCHCNPSMHDWDFFKSLVLKEQNLVQENSMLKAQHTVEQQELQGSLAALRLSLYSTDAHLKAAEGERDRAQQLSTWFQARNEDLNMQYNHLFGQFKSYESKYASAEDLIKEFTQTCQADKALIKRQQDELERQATEVRAATAAARELGDLMSGLVASDDIAAASFQGAVDVADLMLRNKFQECEIQSLKDASVSCERAVETDGSVYSDEPLLTTETSKASTCVTDESYIPLPLDDDFDVVCEDDATACAEWEQYRTCRPLTDDLP